MDSVGRDRGGHAWHERHSNTGNCLVHGCVATLAALAGEMAGICDTWLLILGEELATWLTPTMFYIF